MATDYLKDWSKKVDPKNGGFHLAHKSGNHTISFLPNKDKGGYDIKHSGKLIGHNANAAGALKHAVGYFKQNYNKGAPAQVNFPSTPKSQSAAAVSRITKAELIPQKTNYFRDRLQAMKGVHKPYMSQGESLVGELARDSVADTILGRAQKDVAVNQHKQKLGELKNIKPNLPKAELTKAEPKKPKDEYKLMGSAPTREALEAHAKKQFYNDTLHFKDDGTVHTSERQIEGLRHKAAKNRHRLERKIEKSELSKAKIDEGKPVVQKINDRRDRYFRDRLINIKGSFASASIKNKNQSAAPMEFETAPHTKESVKNNAKMTHDNTMTHLKENKPKLPK